MRLGIGSYTYSWAVGVPGYPPPPRPMTATDLLAKAVELGVGVVQIADNLPLDRLTRPERLDLRRRADDRGLTLEVGTAGLEAEKLRAYLDISVELGSRILRTVTDTPGSHPTPAEVVAALRPQLPALRAAGVVLAIENHDRLHARQLRGIVDELDSPLVGICLDTSNSLGCMEGPEHVVEILGPRVVNLHLKEATVFRLPHSKGFLVEGRPAGAGQIDFAWVVRRLRELGSDPNAIVELWPPAGEPAEAVAREEAWTIESVRHLRHLIPD